MELALLGRQSGFSKLFLVAESSAQQSWKEPI